MKEKKIQENIGNKLTLLYLCKCDPVAVRAAWHLAPPAGLRHAQCTLMDGLQEI